MKVLRATRSTIIPPTITWPDFPGLTPVLEDRVARANSATVPGRPYIGPAWTQVAGVVGVRSEKLYAPGGAGGDLITAALPRQTRAMKADIYSPDWSLYQPMMILRYIDEDNYMGVRVRVSTMKLALFAVVAGVETIVANGSATDVVVNDSVITVESRFVAKWTDVVVDDVATPVQSQVLFLNGKIAVGYLASVAMAALFYDAAVKTVALKFINTVDAADSNLPTIDNIIALA